MRFQFEKHILRNRILWIVVIPLLAYASASLWLGWEVLLDPRYFWVVIIKAPYGIGHYLEQMGMSMRMSLEISSRDVVNAIIAGIVFLVPYIWFVVKIKDIKPKTFRIIAVIFIAVILVTLRGCSQLKYWAG